MSLYFAKSRKMSALTNSGRAGAFKIIHVLCCILCSKVLLCGPVLFDVVLVKLVDCLRSPCCPNRGLGNIS